MSQLVFVYGPLRRGGDEAFYVENAEFVARGLARGKLFDVSGLACFVCDDTGGFVAGELYRVHGDWAGTLGPEEDGGEIREESVRYRKILMKVHPRNLGQLAVDAWLWEWTGPVEGCEAMDPGDWLYHKLPRPAPYWTAVALFCLLFGPAELAAMAAAIYAKVSSGGLPHGVGPSFVAGAIASPLAGIMAALIASRRRERWLPFRRALLALLLIAAVPSVVGMCAIMVEWLMRIF